MKKIAVAITGSTGAIYGYRLLLACKEQKDVETHVVVSSSASTILKMEADVGMEEIRKISDFVYDEYDFTSPIASGSYQTDGMVIVPCSMKTLSSVATGFEQNLVTRAAMVTLKERRPLILLARETPLNLIHLRNMTQITEAGGTIFPPLPPLYFNIKDINEMVDLTVGRVLNMLGIKTRLLKEWKGD